jgi:hypothetical protein
MELWIFRKRKHLQFGLAHVKRNFYSMFMAVLTVILSCANAMNVE